MTFVKDIPGVRSETPSIFEQISNLEHEQVVFCHDKDTGLKAIIAVHSTTLGPSLGGTRMWNYASDADALTDVLRLSRGMTYKAAISGINLGGGKAVIIGDPYKDKSEALMRRYGKFIDGLGGKYITAEDVGTTTQDMEYIAMETEFVTGLPPYMGGSGNPSEMTAYGTFLGIKASVKFQTGSDSLSGKKVAVQGAGSVGEHLVKLLTEAGAKVFISDIKAEKVKKVAEQYKAQPVASDEIYDLGMDIYSPCALGATVNFNTLSRLKCSIIAGSANNQLEDEELHAEVLKDKGILYAPDFLINAGGVINVYLEWVGYNHERALAYTEQIYTRTLEIFNKAQNENISAHQAAMRIAEQRIRDVAKLRAKD